MPEVARAAATLAAAGVDTPRLDAELLLGSVLGVDRTRLLIDGSDPVPAAARAQYDELLARRAAREPVAYILGQRPSCSSRWGWGFRRVFVWPTWGPGPGRSPWR